MTAFDYEWKLTAERIEEASLFWEYLALQKDNRNVLNASIWRDRTFVHFRISQSIIVSCSWPRPNPLGCFIVSNIETAIVRNGETDASEVLSHTGYEELMNYIDVVKFENRPHHPNHEDDWSHSIHFNYGE